MPRDLHTRSTSCNLEAIVVVIGIVGAIYYGSQFVKEEVNGGGTLPSTTPSQIKNIFPVEFEIAFVVVMLVGFGILCYGVVGSKFDKPPDFNPI